MGRQGGHEPALTVAGVEPGAGVDKRGGVEFGQSAGDNHRVQKRADGRWPIGEGHQVVVHFQRIVSERASPLDLGPRGVGVDAGK